ncbi:hypothetical protein JQ600_02565 [Bradyrhizobium sp. AUGA SZCCT0176]|uniref:hypothetical protein n=1 Tax=Bradyrhizobium sp. AUGA SZCCT0176 TaxID=2807664 RepID=UPI001BABBBEA|nr:hypothetical protein [Bradyrhizobium sp. AUGA SZCCT0176]MBR1223781.1 hypothetical protein [Bradyrhizobium sp. AUGA SZCCT0176]
MRRIASIIVVSALSASAPSALAAPKNPQQAEFEKRFDREAVLVRTCPGDPAYASGPTSNTQRVYRFEKELWVRTVKGYQRVDGAPDTVCELLIPASKK